MSPAEIQQRVSAAYRLFAGGDLAGATRDLEAVIAAAPKEANAWHLLAGVKRAAGDPSGALAAFDKAVRFAPQAAMMHFNRANLLLELGRFADALDGYNTALKLRPDHAETHLNRARALEGMSRFDEALAGYDEALRGSANFAGQGRALCLAALGRNEEALQAFNAALASDPGNADILFNRGQCLQALNRQAEALADYDKVIALQSGNAGGWNNRGVALHELDRQEEALASFDEALRLRPDRADTVGNRGLALFALKRVAEAIPVFDRALELAKSQPLPPDRAASLRYNRGAAALALGDLGGFDGFEARWDAGVVRSPKYDRGEPRWCGDALVGTLRVWPEQGIGDEILFSRLTELARARVSRVVLECAPRLVPLFARSFEYLDVRAVDSNAERADAQIVSGSLGAALKLNGLSGAPYLKADTARAAAIRERYAARAAGRPIIGIAWVSNNAKFGHHKTSDLSEWGALLSRDALFVNLQYGDVASDIAAAEKRFGCTILSDPEVDQMVDLDAFAAQIAAMDRIVSVSNTTVHMAGALGAPCIVLTPPGQGLLWYWGAEGERTPWYDSVRVVRRTRKESWADQVQAAAKLL